MTILQKQYKSSVLAINDANDDVGDWHFVGCFYCKGEDAGQEKLIVLLHDGGWSADALSPCTDYNCHLRLILSSAST